MESLDNSSLKNHEMFESICYSQGFTQLIATPSIKSSCPITTYHIFLLIFWIWFPRTLLLSWYKLEEFTIYLCLEELKNHQTLVIKRFPPKERPFPIWFIYHHNRLNLLKWMAFRIRIHIALFFLCFLHQ